MIHLSHIYKTYPGPVHALRDIDFKVEKGDFIFMTGPSGSGKTTIFKMVCGFDRPTSGQINVMGYNLERMRELDIPTLRRKIGVVFQDFKLLRGRTVAENVALPLEIIGEKTSAIQKRVAEVLDQVGLRFKHASLPDQLSGGEQQRVAIARALVHRPGILIADEPTGNLDPEMSHDIMALFKTVNAQGTTVFVATHDHELVSKFGKRRIEIRDGCLVGRA
ncbi:MAG TPA: cell division ATP-binding protein FtsE [Bdellovibrionales bacterium]|nr:cell division ATP-binding protein FtsE [Bdellovibrionales bacterium]